MEIKASLRFLRHSPYKTRNICDIIRGMDVTIAESQLHFMPQKAAGYVLKLLNSAIANATNNFSLKKEDLYIKKIFANEGPTLYRWVPRAFGRATPIRKRSTHLTIILGTKKEIFQKKREKIKNKKIDKEEVSLKKEVKMVPVLKKEKKDDLKLKRKEVFIKKIFKRKTI